MAAGEATSGLARTRKDPRMSRILPTLLLSVGLCAVSSHLSAQPLGSKGDAIFGAERLFGVRGENFSGEPPEPAEPFDVSETTIGFGFAESLTPYNMPRVTFDYMLIDKLSLGGALGFSTTDTEVEGPGGAFGSPKRFVVAPRVGFLHMFGRVAGIWPRGGLSYHSQSVEDAYSESGFSLNLECNFPIVMVEHFGVLVGVAFDRSLTASRDPEDFVEYDVSYQSFGLNVALFGWL
jgi:hypothetical protein